MSLPLIKAPDPLKPYFESLGHFVSVYAKAEGYVRDVLRIEARMSVRTFNAVLSGVRASDAASNINRLKEARGEAKDELLDGILAQFGHITKTRNEILHYGIRVDGQVNIRVTNADVANSKTRIREYGIANNTRPDDNRPETYRRVSRGLWVVPIGHQQDGRTTFAVSTLAGRVRAACMAL